MEESLMTLTKSVTDILDGTIESVKAILPFDISMDQPSLFTESFTQHSIGVLIGMTGDVRGQILVDGDEDTFGKIGESMFGMRPEGEMLESFAGEFGNMIAGNLSTTISQRGYDMDITPPTVLVGKTTIKGFDKAFHLPIHSENAGTFGVILMVELI
jgi:chemotaxis protein CheX